MMQSARTMSRRREMPSLLLSHTARRRQRITAALGSGFLLAVTSLSTLAVLFIFYFIARDALPFFRLARHKG
jgi:phosphate transport system permease protein